MRAFLYTIFCIAFFYSGSAQQGPFIKTSYSWVWAARSNAPMRMISPPDYGKLPNFWADDYTDVPRGSFSAGQAAWVEVGYRFSERAAATLAGRYVFSPTEWHYSYPSTLFQGAGETILRRRAEKPFFLEPGVELYLSLGKAAEVHLRTGFLLPIRHSIRAETYTLDTATPIPFWQTSAQLRTRFGIGGFGGLGATVDLGSGFAVLAQGDIGLLSLRAKDEVVESVLSPGGMVQELPESNAVVNYTGELVGPNPGFDNRPSERPTYLVPFNFWSVEIGVSWAVGG